nr:MAG TPA: hypothetical protein [Caudoviricetes sp.]
MTYSPFCAYTIHQPMFLSVLAMISRDIARLRSMIIAR